jgi:TonB family protein
MKQLIISALALISSGCVIVAQQPPVFDETIKPIYFETLTYPLMARISHVQGVVVLRVTLNNEGRVVSATPISGPKALLSDCVANSRKWRFEPTAEKIAVIVYEFRIDGLCQLPCASQFTFRPPNAARITTGEAVVDHAGQVGKDEPDRKK